MRILFAVRLFRGFHGSVASGIWSPWGAPTIFKLIDALDASNHDLTLVFTCKEELDDLDTAADRQIRLDCLNSDVTLVGGEARIPAWTGRLRWYLSEWRQSRVLLRLAKQCRPDLIYIDRGNLWSASLLARHGPAPVVYRIMGISPSLTQPYKGNRPHQLLNRYQLRAPFDLVICSQDGSGGEYWLDRILDPSVERVMLLNGVDLPEPAAEPTSHGDALTNVLFVGRLDPLKGCDEFLTAFLQAWQIAPDQLRAIIVGQGPREADLRRQAAEAGAEDAVTFTGAVSNEQVLMHYRQADIYVSLNKMGNLSNANLEAMRSGCCMILPDQQPEFGVDQVIAEMFPGDSLLRIPDVGDIQALTQAILQLHLNPQERRARGLATMAVAERMIPSWRQRIDAEVGLLENLAAGTPDGPAMAGNATKPEGRA